MIALLVLAVVLIGVAAAIGIGALIATRAATNRLRTSYDRSNQVVPGIPSPAPTSWLGSHDPEAKLHRRLKTAIESLHAGQNLDLMGRYLDLQVEIEQQALAIDNDLVATSRLPVHLREEPLERLTAAVATIEEAAAEIGRASSIGASHDLEKLLRTVRERTSSLDRAAEVLRELDDHDEVSGEESGGAPA